MEGSILYRAQRHAGLFNGGVSSTYLYRCILVNRNIENALAELLRKSPSGASANGVGIHGNRIIAGLVFSSIKDNLSSDSGKNFVDRSFELRIKNLTSSSFLELAKQIGNKYKNPVLPTLFKNSKKCQELFDLCQGKVFNQEDEFSGIQAELNLL